MKSYSISSFFFALNVFVSANPLVQRATFGGSSDNPLGSQTPNGDLLAPYNPPTTSEEGGEFCGVQLVRKPSLDICCNWGFVYSEILNSTSIRGQ